MCIYIYIYTCIYTYTTCCCFFAFDSASFPFKFLKRLPSGCSEGEGTPPETLKCLTPNPYR